MARIDVKIARNKAEEADQFLLVDTEFEIVVEHGFDDEQCVDEWSGDIGRVVPHGQCQLPSAGVCPRLFRVCQCKYPIAFLRRFFLLLLF